MPVFLPISNDVGFMGLKDEGHCQSCADHRRPGPRVMNDRAQSKDGDHEKGSDSSGIVTEMVSWITLVECFRQNDGKID